MTKGQYNVEFKMTEFESCSEIPVFVLRRLRIVLLLSLVHLYSRCIKVIDLFSTGWFVAPLISDHVMILLRILPSNDSLGCLRLL